MTNGFHEWMNQIPLPDKETMQNIISEGRQIQQKKKDKSSFVELLLQQVFFLKSKIWFFQVLFVFVGCYISSICLRYHMIQQLHFLLSIIPVIISIFSIPLLLKSVDCNTIELENVTYYRYQHILISRIFIISIVDLLCISLLISMVYGISTIPLEQVILYSLVPFNLTCLISFVIMYFCHQEQCVYYCIATTIFFSALLFIVSNTQLYIEVAYLFAWRILLYVSIGMVLLSIISLILQAQKAENLLEERGKLLWN